MKLAGSSGFEYGGELQAKGTDRCSSIASPGMNQAGRRLHVANLEAKGREALLGGQTLLERVRRYPIMDRLEQEDLAAILPYLRENEYSGGTVMLRQGQVSGSFHILLSGKADVYLERDIKVTVAKLERGHFFGEMSCLTGEAVSATVQAEGGAVRTLSMPRDGILLLMDRSPSFRKQMIEAMIRRIGKSNERVVEEHAKSLVVMQQMELERQSRFGPLVGSSLFMARLRERVGELAAQKGPVCIVGEKGTGKLHLAYEIHRRSGEGRSPLLTVDAADFHDNEWESKLRAMKGGTVIVEQADRLSSELLHRLLHAADQTRLLLTARELPPLFGGNVHTVKIVPLRERAEDIPELVHAFLAKAGASRPNEAISPEALRMIGIYPFLRENISELQQLVRQALVLSDGKTILNKHLRFGGVREPGARPKIGLALGSGSVRGAAHVGVLKVLEEEGIPVDLIAGASVGAFLGALYAGGQPISAFEKVLPTVRWRQLVRFALSPEAFVDNSPMVRFIENFIGPVRFEELPIPFAAVAADAVTGEACILNKGRVSHAICASTAIPGIMKPVRVQDRTLVDGGVVHPVPVALAKSMGADIVIAVDVSSPAFSKKAPKTFISSILNTIDIMSEKIVREEIQLADVVLKPHQGSNQLTFKASPSLIRMGEKAAREAVASIQAKIEASTVRIV